MNKVAFRSARPEEAEAVVSLVATVFNGSTDHYRSLIHGDPLLDFDHIQVAIADGRIVSTVWVIPRPVRWCGGTMMVGGIGNVVTHPDYRGRGYATRLMEEAMRFMKARGYPLALLRTEIPSYYAKLGWEIWPTCEWRIPVAAEVPSADDSYWVRPFDKSRDLEAVMDLYAKFNQYNNGTVIRSRAYWEAHFSWTNYEIEEDADAFLVAEDARGLAGYVRATKKGRVVEAAWHHPVKETPWILLGALLWYGREQAWEDVIFPLECLGLDFLKFWCSKPAGSIHSRRYFDLMVQPVDVEGFKRASGCNHPEVGWLDLLREHQFHYWMTDYF